MICVQFHEFFCQQDGFIQYRLKQGSPVTDFQNGKTGIPEIQNGFGGFFKNFFRQNAWTRIEIMYHSWFDLGAQFNA